MDKFVDALIKDAALGSSNKFDHLATNIFLEQTKVRNFDVEYFVPFFCSLSIFLGADDIRQKYGLEKTFFGWYPDSSTLKVIFMSKKSKIIVRNFFLGEIKRNAPRLLSRVEYSQLKSLVRSYELNRWVYSHYKKQLGSGLIGLNVNFNTYLSHYILRLGLPENADFARNLEVYLNSHADLLDTYKKNYKEYLIQNVRSEETSSKTIPLFSEVFSKEMTYQTMNDRLGSINAKLAQVTGFYPETGNNAYSNNLIIVENLAFIVGENMVSSLSKIFRTLNFLDKQKGFMKNIFQNIGQIYSVAEVWLGENTERVHWKEVAFTHGALSALNIVSPTNEIKVLETTYPGGESSELFMVMEPKLQSNIIVESTILSFSYVRFTSRDLALCDLQNTITGKYQLMKLDYRKKRFTFNRRYVPQELDFLQELMIQLNLNAKPEGIKDLLSERLDILQPQKSDYHIANTNFLSRYFLGMFSTLDKRDGVNIFLAKSKDTNTVSYFAEIHEGSPIFRTKHLLINIHEKNEIFQPENALSDGINEGDTVVIDVFQSFLKTTVSSCNLIREIKVGFTSVKSLQVNELIQSKVDQMSIDSYLKNSVEDNLKGLYNELFSYISKYSNLVRPSVLDGNTPYEYASNFKAVLEGMFHKQLKSKNRLTLEPSLSSVQYTFNLHSDQKPRAESDDEIDYSSDSDDDSGSDDDSVHEEESTAQETIDPVELATINFKFGSRKSDGQSLNAMREMIDQKKKVHTKCYHINLVIDGEHLDGNSLTEEDFSAQCSRSKRSGVGCIRDEDDAKRLEMQGAPKGSLENLAAVCNYMMMGLMVRDLIADAAKGEKSSAVKDAAFLLGATFSSTLGKALTKKGASLVANGAKFSGLAAKALGFGISRAISMYVLYDFGSNLIHYLQNKNDTSAGVGAAVDGAFLTIDAITATVEVLEAAQLIAGVSAITGPLGIIAGTALILGLNIYQTVSQIRAIEKVIPLSTGETVEETFRAFFHLDPAANIRELMDEKAANEHLAKKAAAFLKSQNQYTIIIVKSGEIVDKQLKIRQASIIDLQKTVAINVSRASPVVESSMQVICPVHLESSEIDKPHFWTNLETSVTNLVSKIEQFIILAKGGFSTNRFQKSGRSHLTTGYTCHNAFGISKIPRVENADSIAYFKLDDGHDIVKGFINVKNVFHLGTGKKYILGGMTNDKFIVTSTDTSGILHGASGFDAVDFSSLNETVVHFNGNKLYSNHKSLLTLHDIELLLGRRGLADKLNIVDCSLRQVSTLGGSTNNPDSVLVQNVHCTHNLTLFLEGHTVVKNYAGSGNFTYIVNSAPNTNVHIYLHENTSYNHIALQQNFTKLVKMEVVEKDALQKVIFHYRPSTKVELLCKSTLNNRLVSFADGSRLLLSPNSSTLIVNSEMSTEKILRRYKNKVKQLGVNVLLAHSSADSESVLFATQNLFANATNRLLHVVHNSLEHKTRLILDHGQYLILINGTVMKNETVNFNEVTLEVDILRTVGLTLDFNLVNQRARFVNTSGTYFIVGRRIVNDLQIDIIDTDIGYLIGRVTIRGAFVGNFHEKIILQNLSMLKVKRFASETLLYEYEPPYDPHSNIISLHMANVLEVVEREYSTKDQLILLTTDNVEWFDRIYINLTIGRMDFYHINHTSLIITNAAIVHLIPIENLCTITVENFFISQKLQTMTIRTPNQKMIFFFMAQGLRNVPSVEDLWNALKMNSRLI